MTKQELIDLRDKVIGGYEVTFDEAMALTQTSEKETLYTVAGDIKNHFLGNTIEMCSIINARSGKCTADCSWCAQSAHFRTKIETYDFIDPKEAYAQAKENAGFGVAKFSLVTSGLRLSNNDLTKALSIYKEIKETTDIKLCASMGLMYKEQLQQLKDVGVEHYHCNLETAPSHFENLVKTHTMEDKIQTIGWAKEVGLSICSGGIIGMGENMQQRIELALELRKIGAHSIPINLLQAIEGTPLEGQTPLNDEEILVSFAIFRIINTKAQIRFAGGRSSIAHLQKQALNAGISAALVGNLLTTVGTTVEEDLKLFEEMNLEVVR